MDRITREVNGYNLVEPLFHETEELRYLFYGLGDDTENFPKMEQAYLMAMNACLDVPPAEVGQIFQRTGLFNSPVAKACLELCGLSEAVVDSDFLPQDSSEE